MFDLVMRVFGYVFLVIFILSAVCFLVLAAIALYEWYIRKNEK